MLEADPVAFSAPAALPLLSCWVDAAVPLAETLPDAAPLFGCWVASAVPVIAAGADEDAAPTCSSGANHMVYAASI